MKTISNRALFCSLAVLALAVAGMSSLQAQQTAEIKRTVLIKHDGSMTGHEAVMASVEIPPGLSEAKHTHPGDLTVYLAAGALTVQIEGEPTIDVKAGEAFFVPAEKVHWASNKGSVPARTIGAFYVEKGKPLSSPAK